MILCPPAIGLFRARKTIPIIDTQEESMPFHLVSETAILFRSWLHPVENIAPLLVRGIAAHQADEARYLDRLCFQVDLEVRGMTGLS